MAHPYEPRFSEEELMERLRMPWTQLRSYLKKKLVRPATGRKKGKDGRWRPHRYYSQHDMECLQAVRTANRALIASKRLWPRGAFPNDFSPHGMPSSPNNGPALRRDWQRSVFGTSPESPA